MKNYLVYSFYTPLRCIFSNLSLILNVYLKVFQFFQSLVLSDFIFKEFYALSTYFSSPRIFFISVFHFPFKISARYFCIYYIYRVIISTHHIFFSGKAYKDFFLFEEGRHFVFCSDVILSSLAWTFINPLHVKINSLIKYLEHIIFQDVR